MLLEAQCIVMADFFSREKIDFAVVGAFALHAYGYTRATKDIDFLTRNSCQKKVIGFLEASGYSTLHVSGGYSNHLHESIGARIDIIYVDDVTADIVFGSIQKKKVFTAVTLPVISAEHLIALKLFAVQNDPDRKFKELSDIKELLRATVVDHSLIKKFFMKYKMEEFYNEIIEKSQ